MRTKPFPALIIQELLHKSSQWRTLIWQRLLYNCSMAEETPEDMDAYISISTAARRIGVDPSSLYRRVYSGRLQTQHVAGYTLTTLRWVAASAEPGTRGRPPKPFPAEEQEIPTPRDA